MPEIRGIESLAQSAVLKSISYQFTQGQGRIYQEIWEAATRYTAESKFSDLINQGFNANLYQNGPKYIIEASRQSNDSEIVIRWEFNKEMIEKSIWTLPLVKKTADLYNGDEPNNKFRRAIEDALNTGSSLPDDILNNNQVADIAIMILHSLRNGEENYYAEVYVLSKIVTVNLTYLPFYNIDTYFSPSNGSIVYKHDYFKSHIISGAPSTIQSMVTNLDSCLTKDPDDDIYVWGWRMRAHQGEYEYSNNATRFNEVLQWEFAKWSSFLYLIYPQ
jgi:hypothetical protein